MAVSPYHIWYGQEAKMYALISFLAPLSLLLLLRAVRGGSRWLWLAWAVLMGLFLYIHLFAVMMALVAIAWLAALLRRRPRLTSASGLAATLVVLASLPVARWLLPAALTPAETGYYRYGLVEMVSILFHNFSMGLRPAAGLWPALLFLALLLLGCVPLVAQTKSEKPSEVWQAQQARSVLLLLLYLLVPLLAIWLVSLRRPTFTDRYLIISLPAFSLLIASGILVGGRTIALLMGQKAQKQALAPTVQMARPGEQRGRRRRIAATRVGERYGLERQGAAVPVAPAGAPHLQRWLSVGLLGLVILVSSPFVWAQTHNPYKADFRAAARYITERAGPDDLFVFVMPYVQRSFAYYHAQPVRAVEPPYTRDMSQTQVDATLGAQTADSRRVWLFLSEQEFWDPQGLIAMWFDRHAARRCQEFFAYIEVRCYDMR